MSSMRVIVWVLCALIIAVSLDAVPDPPAVKDTYKFDNPILSGDHFQILPSHLRGYRHFLPLSHPMRWNAVVYVGEPDRSGEHHARLWRSTDTSPPTSVL